MTAHTSQDLERSISELHQKIAKTKQEIDSAARAETVQISEKHRLEAELSQLEANENRLKEELKSITRDIATTQAEIRKFESSNRSQSSDSRTLHARLTHEQDELRRTEHDLSEAKMTEARASQNSKDTKTGHH